MSLLLAKTSGSRTGGPSFSLQHRLERAVWSFVWGAFGSWTPTTFHHWRRFLLNIFGAKLAASARVYPGVRVWYPRNLEMGEFACLGPGVNCYCMDRVVLGAYALVSQRAFLCGGTHMIDDPHFQLQVKPIYIGANAWVAAEAFVGPGVSIGDGAVLGARAVTMKNLEPWTVYVGNPAKGIRLRSDSAIGGFDG